MIVQPGSPAHDRQLLTWSDELDRLTARFMRPVPTCEGCRRFVRDTINPGAGMGGCERGLGHHYPMQRHHCRQREAIASA